MRTSTNVKLRTLRHIFSALPIPARLTSACIAIVCCTLYCTGCKPAAEQQEPPQAAANSEFPSSGPQRIISTLPSITEVLFDIGLGSRIVGVSSFTAYPPEAAKIDKIGGLYDINHEKILSLKADILFFSVENKTLRKSLTIPSWTVDHRTLQGVLDSYTIIGALFDEEVFAAAKVKQSALKDRLDAFAEKAKDRVKVRTLICIDRSRGTGKIQNLFVAGRESFLTDALRFAGGENAAEAAGRLAPTLSAEGVIGLAPEVIIDLCVNPPDAKTAQVGLQHDGSADTADWQSLGDSVPAVKNKRIYKITDDFATVPGPRTPLLIEKMERILHK